MQQQQKQLIQWLEEMVNCYEQKNNQQIINLLQQSIDKKIKFTNAQSSEIQNFFNSKMLQQKGPQFQRFINLCQCLSEWLLDWHDPDREQQAFPKYIDEIMSKHICQYFENIDSEDEEWILPVIKFCLMTSKILFFWSQQESKKSLSKIDNHLQNIINCLRQFSQICNRTRKLMFKKQILLHLINLEFCLNFKNYSYSNCESLLRQVASNLLKQDELKKYQKSERVTFLYYLGRMNIIQSKFKEADQSLTEAAQLCLTTQYKQLRQIYKYLIPVKIFCGQMPNQQIFEQYKLFEYIELIQAIITADINQVNQQLEKWKKLWIKRGLYFVIDRLKLIAYRNLCKKVYKLYMDKIKPTRPNIELKYFEQAFKFSMKDQNIESDEVACIIGNLIYIGLIKGYIFQNQKLVLKEDGSFPQISTVQLKLDIFNQ